ncbi:MAG: ribosome silencing factor [Proteobacteria bacterium]|nr:ribosome silencing factor [Pseudomonadota bacterium]
MSPSRRSPASRRRKPTTRRGPAPAATSPSRKAAAAPARPGKQPRSSELVALEKLALAALEDMKAVNIRVLDVRGLTDIADTMIVASGTSDRHVRSIAENVVVKAKQAGRRPMGTEGRQDAEWVLIDLQDVLVHVMLPRVREFYALEQLWEAPQAQRRSAAGGGASAGAGGTRGAGAARTRRA